MKKQLRKHAKPHHSSGDWDFANTNWELNSSVYVSSPSSLRFLATNNTKVKTTTVPIANVKEGRIITYIRAPIEDNRTEIVFRWQDNNNYYCVALHFSGVAQTQYIYRRQGGENTILNSASKQLALNAWHKFRVTWWNDYVGLVIRVEIWQDGAWITLIADGYDALNLWNDVGGRLGIGDFGITTASGGIYVDDTYIYGIG